MLQCNELKANLTYQSSPPPPYVTDHPSSERETQTSSLFTKLKFKSLSWIVELNPSVITVRKTHRSQTWSCLVLMKTSLSLSHVVSLDCDASLMLSLVFSAPLFLLLSVFFSLFSLSSLHDPLTCTAARARTCCQGNVCEEKNVTVLQRVQGQG